MEFFNTHQLSLRCKTRIRAVEFPNADDLPLSKSLIRLHLNTVADHHHVVVTDQTPLNEQVFDVAPGEWAHSTVDVDRLAILKPATGELDRILTSELQRSHEYLFESLQQGLKGAVLYIVDKLRNLVANTTKPWEIRAVKINVIVAIKHLCFERLLVQSLLQRSAAGDDEYDGMRPASKFARTQMLTRMSFDNQIEGTTAETEDDVVDVFLD